MIDYQTALFQCDGALQPSRHCRICCKGRLDRQDILDAEDGTVFVHDDKVPIDLTGGRCQSALPVLGMAVDAAHRSASSPDMFGLGLSAMPTVQHDLPRNTGHQRFHTMPAVREKADLENGTDGLVNQASKTDNDVYFYQKNWWPNGHDGKNNVENRAVEQCVKERPPQNLAPVLESGVLVEGGARYDGQWSNNKRHGQGIYVRPDGSWYEGRFEDGWAHGYGKYTAASGNVYEGQWYKDQAHGKGTYSYADGSTYEGEWCLDEKAGQGTECLPGGVRYVGGFVHGKKHGTGLLTEVGGLSYEGEFKQGDMDGEGSCAFPNGCRFYGQWWKGKLDGTGTMVWPDGSKYDGSFWQDMRHGEGTFVDADGCSYQGQWVNGKKRWHRCHHV